MLVIVAYEKVFGNAWSTGGKFFIFFSSLWLIGELVLILPTGGPVYSMLKFLHNSQGGCLRVSDPQGSPSTILYFTRDLMI